MSNHDDSSNRREDDRERALPQRGRLWLGHGIRPARQDGDEGSTPKLDPTPRDVGMVVLDVEQLQAAQGPWSGKRTERLDWINGEFRRQGHAVKTFRDVDAELQENAQVTRHNLDPLGPEPQLADFYHPSDGQKDHEIAFVILGMAATGLVAYRLAK